MEIKKPVNITQVEIMPFRPKDGSLGFAACVVNGQFHLSDIVIFLRPKGGIRLGYPIKMLSNGISLDIFKPLHKGTQTAIEAAIAKKFGSLHDHAKQI